MMQQTGCSGRATAAPSAWPTPAPSMPNLNVERMRVRHAHLVEEHRPDGGVAAVDDEHGCRPGRPAGRRRDVRRSSSAPPCPRAPRRAWRARCAMVSRYFATLRAARVEVHAAPAGGSSRVGQRGEEQLASARIASVAGLVGAEHVVVDVHLDHLLLGRRPPVRRLAPPVGLAERASRRTSTRSASLRTSWLSLMCTIGMASGEVSGSTPRAGPARRHRRVQQLGHAAQLVVRAARG